MRPLIFFHKIILSRDLSLILSHIYICCLPLCRSRGLELGTFCLDTGCLHTALYRDAEGAFLLHMNMKITSDNVKNLFLYSYLYIYILVLFVCLLCYREPRGRLVLWLNVSLPSLNIVK